MFPFMFEPRERIPNNLKTLVMDGERVCRQPAEAAVELRGCTSDCKIEAGVRDVTFRWCETYCPLPDSVERDAADGGEEAALLDVLRGAAAAGGHRGAQRALPELPPTVTTVSCDDNLHLVPLSAHTYVAYPNRKHQIPDFIPRVVLRNFRDRVWSRQELHGLRVATLNCPQMNY